MGKVMGIGIRLYTHMYSFNHEFKYESLHAKNPYLPGNYSER